MQRGACILAALLLVHAEARAENRDTSLAAARRQVEAREYHASQNRVGLQAPNRAQNLRTYFDTTGIRVHDRTAPASPELLALSLGRVGRGEALAKVEPGSVKGDGARVEIRREGLVEWYLNSEVGLEQGFWLERRPGGEGPLVVELALRGASAFLKRDAVLLSTEDGRSLRYDHLRVVDASGRVFPGRLEVPAPHCMRILVADAGATYPLVIDPLLSANGDYLVSFGLDDFGIVDPGLVIEDFAVLGDVDGDGIPDLLIGVPSYDGGETEEGAAFVILSGNHPLVTFQSNQAHARFGASVAAAGDVDGSRFVDLIIGAPGYDAGETNEGAAFVYLASLGDYTPYSQDPSTASARLESNQANACLGAKVASAGDVNGDGYADVIVGAPYYDAGETDEGAAFVFLGGPSGIVGRDPTTAAARFEANQPNAHLGGSVASAGDVNGDGYDDVIVGASEYDAPLADEGAAFVFLGGPTGVSGNDPASAATRIESNQLGAKLGTSVAGAGDVNGDGYADVIVGAPLYYAGETEEGAAFVFHGGPTGIADGNPGNAATRLQSDGAGRKFGSIVLGGADFNGDGYADVVVYAPDIPNNSQREAGIYVFLGRMGGIPDASIASADASIADGPSWMIGTAVGIGDLDGDGFTDLYFSGTFSSSPFLPHIFCVPGGSPGVSGDFYSAGTRLYSSQNGSGIGWSVAGAGDVNGDGYADVIVGAPYYDGGETDEGAVFLFLGSATGIQDGDESGAAARLESDQAGAHFGWSVAAAGDVNEDGYADVIVGAPDYDAGETDEGAAFVFHGDASGISNGHASAAAKRLESNQAGARFGASVAGAGDVNGDGYADVIVGAPSYDAGETDEGAAFVFHGSPAGVLGREPGTAATRLQSNQPGARLGASVAGTGVRGFGVRYADVIVGAPDYNAGHGAVFVFAGSSTGVADGNPSTAVTRLTASQAWAFGTSVAGAGDINGDRFADIVVGAPQYSNGEPGEGAAFVFLGSWSLVAVDASGADYRIEGNQANAALGTSVAGIGDADCDGFADVVVGAPGEGAALVFYGNGSLVPSVLDPVTRLELYPGSGFGMSVAGAGDIDGDGFPDVIGGSPVGALIFYGNGGRTGRPVLARQMRGDGSGIPVAPWGGSYPFEVRMLGTHPAGRGRIRLEVQFCEAFDSFVEDCYVPTASPTWTETPAGGQPALLSLIPPVYYPSGVLYHWRARIAYAPSTITAPAFPSHGPWRRVATQAVGADIRLIPEPAPLLSLAAGALLLVALQRRRASRAQSTRAARISLADPNVFLP